MQDKFLGNKHIPVRGGVASARFIAVEQVGGGQILVIFLRLR